MHLVSRQNNYETRHGQNDQHNRNDHSHNRRQYNHQYSLRLGCWNVNGWTRHKNESSDFKSKVTEFLDLDILAISETFLKDNDCIQKDGYKFYGHNRLNIHKRAKRGSGGVGFLIKDSVFDTFDVFDLNKECDGIYWIKLMSKFSDVIFCLCVCYFPPENSAHIIDPNLAYANLIHQGQYVLTIVNLRYIFTYVLS